MSPRTKQILIVIVVIIISFVGYKMFFVGSGSSDTTLVSDQTTTSEFIDGPAILALLNALNQVTLDDSIFANKIFLSLADFEKPIADQAISRPNPFLPIGIDGSGVLLPRSATTTRAR
jgi:hypothetical protein